MVRFERTKIADKLLMIIKVLLFRSAIFNKYRWENVTMRKIKTMPFVETCWENGPTGYSISRPLSQRLIGKWDPKRKAQRVF